MKKLLVILLVFFSASTLIVGQTRVDNKKYSVVLNSRPGLMNITEINVGFGLGDTSTDYSKRFLGLTSILGIGITRYFHGGIGTGISFYNGGLLVPLYLDLRYIFNFGKISAYAFGDGGLLLNFAESDGKTKIFINPGAGLTYPIYDNLTANLGAGLFLQSVKDQSRDSFINFKLGITYFFKNKKN